jgi:hypothetical protein
MQQLAPLCWAQRKNDVTLRCPVTHFGIFVLPDHSSYHCLCVMSLVVVNSLVDLAIPTDLSLFGLLCAPCAGLAFSFWLRFALRGFAVRREFVVAPRFVSN